MGFVKQVSHRKLKIVQIRKFETVQPNCYLGHRAVKRHWQSGCNSPGCISKHAIKTKIWPSRQIPKKTYLFQNECRHKLWVCWNCISILYLLYVRQGEFYKKKLVLSFISFTDRTTLFQMQSPNLEIWNIGFWIIINKPCSSILCSKCDFKIFIIL